MLTATRLKFVDKPIDERITPLQARSQVPGGHQGLVATSVT